VGCILAASTPTGGFEAGEFMKVHLGRDKRQHCTTQARNQSMKPTRQPDVAQDLAY
jgi:hypothetical protein